MLLILHEPVIGTDISAWLLEDLSEDLVTEVFFTGAGEYGLDFTGGGLGVKLFTVLALAGGFVFISFELVET